MTKHACRLIPIGDKISIIDLAEEVKRYTLFELESISGYNNAGIKMIFDQIAVIPFRAPCVQLKSDSGVICINYIDCDVLKTPGDFGCTYTITSRFPISGKEKFPERYKLKCL